MVAYIMYCIIIVYILSQVFNLKKNRYKVKACTKLLLWDAYYDRENNDYMNALRPSRFK